MAQDKIKTTAGDLQEALVDDKDFLRVIVQNFCQEFLDDEMRAFLRADHHERTDDRQGYRNGYKPRTLRTRVGDILLLVPQDRDGNFSTQLFDRYQRSEKAFCLAIAEMYVNGVSTRKVKRIAEELCGVSISKSQVSNLCSKLDAELLAFKNRPLGVYPYLVIDARYEKVRTDRGVVSHAVFIIAGISEEGYREIIAIEPANAENETNWSDIFKSLIQRGLSGVDFVVSDNHLGLVKAIERCFTGATWQRCQCHFMKNILDKAPKSDKKALKADIRAIFDSPAIERARELLEIAMDRYTYVADMLDDAADAVLACFYLPESHRKRMRTTNMMERFNEEIKRRTKVVRIFPNDAAMIRLITALAAEQTEEWLAGRKYMDITGLEDMIKSQVESVKRLELA